MSRAAVGPRPGATDAAQVVRYRRAVSNRFTPLTSTDQPNETAPRADVFLRVLSRGRSEQNLREKTTASLCAAKRQGRWRGVGVRLESERLLPAGACKPLTCI